MEENKLPTKEELKGYFGKGKYPTESQFADFIDSYWHKEEDKLPEETLTTVINRDNNVPEQGIKLVYSGSSPSTKIELRVNHKTWSPWIGNMNPDHTGVYNHSFGYGALQDVTTGDGNVALGNHALWKLTTGIRNTVVGSSSMIALKEGYWNVVVGQAALYYFATGHNNTAVGRVAMNNFIGGYGNTALGSHSGYVDGGTRHTQEYNYNTFLGFRSGYTSDLPNNLKGNNNVTIGANAPIGGNTNNRLVIHSSETVLDHNTALPLIGGDFAEKTLDFDSSLKVRRLPQADSAFTKNIVAKPDGTFGVENKQTTIAIPYIPKVDISTFSQDSTHYYLNVMVSGVVGTYSGNNPFRVFVDALANPIEAVDISYEIKSSGSVPLPANNSAGFASSLGFILKFPKASNTGYIWQNTVDSIFITAMFMGSHNNDVQNNVVYSVPRIGIDSKYKNKISI
ncbi:hypothetical protein [Chryseobacterium sp. MMS23-Vi53]|uniref:hypothetical protein n=1 Tax=Chryseobacterium sp. MMS23-Vi53 TaxID=3386644 RepID=UPI0039E77B73